MTTTPKAWTRGSVKTHLGASLKTLHGLRGEMLATMAPHGDTAHLGGVLQRIGEMLVAETEWLMLLTPVPEQMRKSSRARYLFEYSDAVVKAAEALRKATTPPYAVERFAPFGEALLTVLAYGDPIQMRRL